MKQEFADDYQNTENGASNPHVNPSIGEYTDFEEVE